MTTTPSAASAPSSPPAVQARAGKPRLGESADAVWAGIKSLQGGAVIPGSGILFPTLRVVGGNDHFLSAAGHLQVVVRGAGWDGMCARDATAGEIDEFHRDLEKDFVQVIFLSSPGYGSGYGCRAILKEVHSPSGLGFKLATPVAPSLVDQAPPQGLNLALSNEPHPISIVKVSLSLPVDYLEVPEARREALISSLLKESGIKGVSYYSDICVDVEVAADTDALALVQIQTASQGAERVAKAHGVWPVAPSPLTPNLEPSISMFRATLMTPVSYLNLSDKRREKVVDALMKVDGVDGVEHYDNFCVEARLDDISDQDAWLSIAKVRGGMEQVFEEHKLRMGPPASDSPKRSRTSRSAP
ncbi:MAG: hypothetical protein O9327_10525 [Polaromonas sp.]|nr:hypothetical protein [Polaromonas sp.]